MGIFDSFIGTSLSLSIPIWLHDRLIRTGPAQRVFGTVVAWWPADGEDEALWKVREYPAREPRHRQTHLHLQIKHDDGDVEDADEAEVKEMMLHSDSSGCGCGLQPRVAVADSHLLVCRGRARHGTRRGERRHRGLLVMSHVCCFHFRALTHRE